MIESDYKSVENRGGEDAVRYRLIYQLTRITRDRGALVRDDRLDALAMAVAYWLDYLNRDTKAAQEEHIETLRQIELGRFAEHVVGYQPDPMVWNNGPGR